MANLNWKPFIYGGMASIVAEFGTFPIDLTKTRLQVQGQSQCMEVRYRGMFHALLRIGQEEGVRALYSGISPALLRQASYGTIKIGTYNTLKKLFVSHPEDETMVINVFCGVLSGVLSSSLANPTDVLKIRMQAQGSLLQGSMMANFINIYQQEGTRGLWRVSVCQYIYQQEEAPDPLRPHGRHHIHTFRFQFCVWPGGGASLKPSGRGSDSHDEPAGAGGQPLYKGTLDGLMKTWRNEGFFALYKGFWPNWLRLGPWNIIFFITFEQLKKLPL
ncbi:hypothetical protein ANANG_G00148420 [Anguilla anguilla]|uniref:Solute carrier family 25 member 14 n=1 Tax=Anguilla anguilla TaxID=7936 RepID=A0A9D3M7G6_ANGAN|nr:hypothetical protein ANANG_G00148420 [Anguilla anguilla]